MEKRQLVLGMATVLLLTVIISCANATEVETVTVEPLTKRMLIFDLDKEYKFSGSLSISGGTNNDIDFWVTNPSGNTIVNLGRISQGTTFEITAQESGAYTFHFDNTFSLFSSKTVTLSYDISRPSPLGIAVFTILGLLLLGIGIIIGLGFLLHRRKMQGISEPSQPMPS